MDVVCPGCDEVVSVESDPPLIEIDWKPLPDGLYLGMACVIIPGMAKPSQRPFTFA